MVSWFGGDLISEFHLQVKASFGTDPGGLYSEGSLEVSLHCMFYSSHNWNTLFLGANAVVDVMAEKYGTSKQHILDAVSHMT